MNNKKVIEAVKTILEYNEKVDYSNCVSIVSYERGFQLRKIFDIYLGNEEFSISEKPRHLESFFERLSEISDVTLSDNKPSHYGEDHPHKDVIIEWAKGAPIETICTDSGLWELGRNPLWFKSAQYRVAPIELTEKEKAQEKLKELLSNVKELEEQIKKM